MISLEGRLNLSKAFLSSLSIFLRFLNVNISETRRDRAILTPFLESYIRGKCFMFIVYEMTPGKWYTVNKLVYYKQLRIMAGDFLFIVYQSVYSIPITTVTSPIQ